MVNTEYRNGFGDGAFGVGAFGLDGFFKDISVTASASLTNSITVNRIQSSGGVSTIALTASCAARKLWEAIAEGSETWTDLTPISKTWTDSTSTSTTWTEAA